MGSESLYYLLLASLFGALFFHHNRLNQLARTTAQRYCEQQQLQMLDQAVVLCSLGWQRAHSWVLIRRYRFEFALAGGRRYRGWVVMAGERALKVETQPIPEDEFRH